MMKLVVLPLLLVMSSLVLADVDRVSVDKSDHKMYLYDGDQLVKAYHVVFGGDPNGHKQQEGDQKTPEGTYTLDYIKEDSSYHRAMHISYPNLQDQQRAKELGVSPGGFIMIHGQRNGLGWLSGIMQRFNWTDGCIALTNADMDDFLSRVAVGTPISIDW